MQKIKHLFNRSFGILIAGMAVLMASHVIAGTDSDFSSIVSLLSGWAEGSLGKTIALGTFAVGGAAAIVRQNLMFGAVGTGAAVAMAYGPGILTDMFSLVIM